MFILKSIYNYFTQNSAGNFQALKFYIQEPVGTNFLFLVLLIPVA